MTDSWRQLCRSKWLLGSVGAFALYLATGFFLVPALVKWQLLRRLPHLTHRVAAIRQVKCNPLELSLTIHGLALTETNALPFASFEEFYANFQISSLFRLAWTFDEIKLREPRAQIVLDRDGRFNFANLIDTTTKALPPETVPKSGIPRVFIRSLTVTNGHVGFADLSCKTPFRTTYEPINLDLQHFTTRRGQQSPYSFQASSDSGRSFTWEGNIAAQPLGSTGTLRITGIQLPKHAPYLEDFTRAQLTGGTLDISGQYSFAAGTNGPDLIASNLAVNVANLEIKDPETLDVVAALPSFGLRDGTFDWRARQVRVGSLAVNDPTVLVRRAANGSINIPSLLLRRDTPAEAKNNVAPHVSDSTLSTPWVFALDDCQLSRGSVQLEDATVPGLFRSLLKPVAVRLRHFSTATNTDAAVEAEITTEMAETVRLEATGALSPQRASGKLRLAGVDLKKYQPYLSPWFRGILAAGKTEVSLDFSEGLRNDVLQANITNTAVHVTDLQIRSPNGVEAVIVVPSFTVENAACSLADKFILAGAVGSTGAVIRIRRESDGTIDLLGLLTSRTNSMTGTNLPPASPSPEWKATVNEISLRDWALHFVNRQTSPERKLELDHLTLALRGAQYPNNAPVSAELSTRVNSAGTVAARGTIQPYSPAVDTEVAIADLDLRGFQPWFEDQVKLGIESGTLNASGRLRVLPPMTNGPRIRFEGRLGVLKLATVNQVLFKEFVRWDELAMEGIDLALQPNEASIAELSFSGLRTSVIIDPAKRPNFLSILPAPAVRAPAPAALPEPANAVSASFPFRLGELKFKKTSIHFRDQSVQPPCTFDLPQLDGTVKGISSQANSSADVDISGGVDEAAPFALKGKLNPLTRDVALDLFFTNHNLQMTSFTPYLEKYAGHPLMKGRLSLDLRYAVTGKQLKAQNNVHIDQLTLGPRNQSPEATKLPVKLAVALLKDSSGHIDLNLPIEGRLDDPQFSVGPIILKVLVNLIAKAAASPFKLLGALVGGGEELSYVEFSPGHFELVGAETNKLAKLVEALEKRPALSLEIEGSIDPVADRNALAREMVKDQVKAQRLRELAAVGQAAPSAAGFQLEPVEYERLLRAEVVKNYGTNLAELIRAAAARAAAATNPLAIARPVRDPSWWKRMESLFKPRAERAAIVQSHRAAKADALLFEQNPELARLTAEEMESLLAAKVELAPNVLPQLMQDRAKAVQAHLIASGKVTAERLFIIAPKPLQDSFKGEARANLSLN